MDMNRLTQKSQEALHDAQTKALRFGHVEVDGEHLLLALLDQGEGLVVPLLARAGADPDRLREDLEAELGRRPRVSGPGVTPGQASWGGLAASEVSAVSGSCSSTWIRPVFSPVKLAIIAVRSIGARRTSSHESSRSAQPSR